MKVGHRLWMFFGAIIALAIALLSIPRQHVQKPAHQVIEESYPGQILLGFGWDNDSASKQDRQTFFLLPESDCAAQPQWNPVQPLPKPMPELEQVAFRATFGADPETWKNWKVTNIEFKRFPMSWPQGQPPPADRVDRWSCQLTVTNQDPEHYASKIVCVLLDGTVIAPKTLDSKK